MAGVTMPPYWSFVPSLYCYAGYFFPIGKVPHFKTQQAIYRHISQCFFSIDCEGANIIAKGAHFLLDSIRFCQLNQGLQLHAWVLMINHLHLLSRRGFRKDDLSLINASSAKPRRYTCSKTKIRNYDTLYNFYTALQQLVAVITMIPRRYFLSGRSPTVTKILKVRQ